MNRFMQIGIHNYSENSFINTLYICRVFATVIYRPLHCNCGTALLQGKMTWFGEI